MVDALSFNLFLIRPDLSTKTRGNRAENEKGEARGLPGSHSRAAWGDEKKNITMELETVLINPGGMATARGDGKSTITPRNHGIERSQARAHHKKRAADAKFCHLATHSRGDEMGRAK